MLTIVFWLLVACLAYVYFVYPLLMVLVSAIVPRPQEAVSWEPSVSLLIPAYNEASVIAQKMHNAFSLEYPAEKLEILVGSDCSSDDTVRLAQSFASRGVKVFAFSERRGKASVLNDLVAAATGEVLLLCDANVMFHTDALRRLLARLAHKQTGAVTGDVRLKSEDASFGFGERLYYFVERWIQIGESTIGSLMGVDGGMYALRRELFTPVPADTILDDFVISMNVIAKGKRVVYEPSAIADENATPTARAEFRRRMRVSAGAMQSILRGNWPSFSRPVELWQYVSHKALRWTIPLLLLALLAVSSCLWNEGAIYRWALTAQIAGYLLALAGAVSVRIRETRLIGVPFYFVLTFAAMLAGMLKALLFRQSGAWAKTERIPSAA